jgi:hypothetical protein
MLLAAGVSGSAMAGEFDVEYLSAVPAVELTGPQVARSDYLREVELAAFVEAEERAAPRRAMGEIHYDPSAVPVAEWVGPEVAWPDRLREAAFAAFEAAPTPEVAPPSIEDIQHEADRMR